MSEIITKHFQLLMTVLPKLSRLAVLLNPGSSTRPAVLKSIEDAARTQRIIVMPVDVRNSDDIEHGFVKMRREGAEALIVVADAFIISQLPKIAALGFQLKLPSIFEFREFPEAGGLFSYGTNQRDVYRRAATYVDKILKGAKPADLPVEQPTKFEFIINLKTARSFGLDIPPKLLFTADEGKKFGPNPMNNAMVCHMLEGELEITQNPGSTITAKKNHVWTYTSGMTEGGVNKGTTPATMRITQLLP